MLLQRLLNRLTQRRRVARLLLASQPMLRRTVVGRRLSSAFRVSNGLDWYESAPTWLPNNIDPIPALAELLPEPQYIPREPVRMAAPRTPTPERRPVQAPGVPAVPPTPPQALRYATSGEAASGSDSTANLPVRADRAQALPLDAGLPTSVLPIAPNPVQPTVAPAIPPALPTQPPVPAAVPPVPAVRSAPETPPVTPRRRQSRIVELPVAPEVARSIAAAAGDVLPSEPTPTSPPRSAAEISAALFMDTPRVASQEWAKRLFAPQTESPASTPSPEPAPALALIEAIAEDTIAEQRPSALPDRSIENSDAVGSDAAIRSDINSTVDTNPAPAGVVPDARALHNAADQFVQSVQAEPLVAPFAEALAALAPENRPQPSIADDPGAVPPDHAGLGVEHQHTDLSGTPLTVDVSPAAVAPVPPMLAGTAPSSVPAVAQRADVPDSGLPEPSSRSNAALPGPSPRQAAIDRAVALIAAQNRAAQGQLSATSSSESVPAGAPIAPPAATVPVARAPEHTDTRSAAVPAVPGTMDASGAVAGPANLTPADTGVPAVTGNLAQPTSDQPELRPVNLQPVTPGTTPERGAVAGPADMAAGPGDLTGTGTVSNQPQPRPASPQPSAERRLNERPWIPRPPGAAQVSEAEPRLSDELFREDPGRSAQEWAGLLFASTHPQAWGRQRQADPVPPGVPATPQQPIPAKPPTQPSATVESAQAPQRPAVRQPATRVEPIARPLRRPSVTLPAAQPGVIPGRMQPSPLTEGTRRFLRPIVGIDPADVRVYRGAMATQITEAYSADGLNSGDAIVLGPGNEDETRPETLGLLAHELTHAAQRGEVGYIPPIAQGRVPVTATPEDIAQIAEQAARRAARRFAAPAIGRQASAPASQPNNENERAASVPDELDTSESPDRSRWGELPAPWEPLPTWDDAAPAVEAPVPLRSSSTPRAAALLAAPVEASAPILPAVALAEVNRAIGDGEQSQPASGHESQQPAPDLDALARQVYDMLKQRLATERRRLG